MKFELYKDRHGEWRWRLRARNGKAIAESGEGYKQRARCVAGIRLVRRAVTLDAPVVEADAFERGFAEPAAD